MQETTFGDKGKGRKGVLKEIYGRKKKSWRFYEGSSLRWDDVCQKKNRVKEREKKQNYKTHFKETNVKMWKDFNLKTDDSKGCIFPKDQKVYRIPGKWRLPGYESQSNF